LPALQLPEAVYDVLIEPAAGADGAQLMEVDLSPGVATPQRLALGAPARVRGVVTDASGAALAGVRVSATPSGALAGATTAGAAAVTGATGEFVLSLAGGGDYELAWTTADARHARARQTVRAPGAGAELDLAAVSLAPALRVSGRVTIAGGAGGSAGVTLQLLCFTCNGAEPSWPVAEAVTGATGEFALAVPDPDPGVAAPGFAPARGDEYEPAK
jgi:hypothetical protein